MPSVFLHADGTACRNPTSLSDARRYRKARYDDLVFCPKCEERNALETGNRCSTKYTVGEKCIHCARMEAILFYNGMILSPKDPPVLTEPTDDMHKASELFPFPIGTYTPAPTNPSDALAQDLEMWIRPEACNRAGHLGIRTINGECYICEKEAEAKRNNPRIAARNNGDIWYTPSTACPDCGEIAPRHTRSNRCRKCRPLTGDRTSPRQQAIAAGEIWYTPDTPCPRCGTTAPRRVNNGACQGCQQPVADTATASLMKDCPDLVMSRDDARTAGMTVYRTGKPCKRQHEGFRYVSTGGCIECLRS